jgi:transposase InsO family protein
VVVALRRHTLLPLDGCLYALPATIPHLTRSSLHSCLQRHGISRLPEIEGEKTAKRKVKSYPIGYFHVDIAEILTANGVHFTTPGAGGSAVPLIKQTIANGELFRAHSFELACAGHDIDHRLTNSSIPWTNGQVERINRTIKDATVKRYHYDSHDQLRQHLGDFVAASNL